MKRVLFALFAVAALGVAPQEARAIEGRLMRHPAIHGDRIAFTYEDDLWSAPSAGGLATRLTTHPGIEQYAAFSPDGKWIAFTGSYDGGHDVYVIPATGGEPVRLTYHPAYNRV
ncbi:MAG TPA: protease, partial [Candidatus Bathyarchaeia archaeon]|nr:protease [Candidatus Bathyarchaeia archaeon]